MVASTRITLATAALIALACGGCTEAPASGADAEGGARANDAVAAQDSVDARFRGEPWTGSLRVDVVPPQGERITRWGQGSARFTGEDGQDGHSRLVVFGAVDDEQGDAGFTLAGRPASGGWSSSGGAVALSIAPDGRISGGGDHGAQSFALSGHADATRFNLLVELTLHEDTAAGLPAGTVFHFDYALSRAEAATPESGAETAGKRGDTGKCRRIRYEMRPVANIGDGSMSMISVPVCLK